MKALKRLQRFYKECVRVLKVTKKPSGEEFKTIVKVSGIGILAIGAIGFIIHMIYNVLIG
ncbi:MAG: protein translocase SEC61 complex subunit gamma [Nanobdellota archaeon]